MLLYVRLMSACLFVQQYVTGGDSGELVAEGCILGTAHPPGYPLLTMLVYLLKEWLPLSLETFPVAYRVNVVR